MTPKSTQSISQILVSQSRRPPKKFLPPLVNEIYLKISSPNDLENLLHAKYLNTVAWKFFHPDVSNTHVELILVLAFHDTTIRGSFNTLQYLSLDADKFGLLIKRVLQTTLTGALNERIADFEYLTYLFLASLLQHNHKLLLEHELFEQWLQGVLDGYTDHFLQQEIKQDNVRTACALLYFLAIAIKMSILPIVESTKLRCFFSGFVKCADPQVNLLVKQIVGSPSHTQFTSLQRKARELSVDFLSECLLPYDLDTTILHEKLEDLDLSVLQELSRTAGYSGSISDSEFLAQVVVQNCVPQVGHNSQITETELFDTFNNSTTLGQAVPTPWLVPEDLDRWRYETLASLNQHLVLCFQRLDVQKDGVKGASKYYTSIDKIEHKGADCQIHLQTKKNLIRPGNLIVLVKVDKPDKSHPATRVRKYGIVRARIVEVLATSTKTLSIHLPEKDPQYNGILTLPSQGKPSILSSMKTNSYIRSFEGQFTSGRFRICNVDESVTSFKREVQNDSSRVFEYKSSTFEVTSSESALSPELSKALLELLSSKVSRIQYENHSDTDALVNAALEALVSDLAQDNLERCLILLPTQNHVQRFKIEDRLLHLCHRAGDIGGVQNTMNSILQEVQKLSEKLELQEYDFGTSMRNAIIFYETHVEPRWTEYLKTLKKTITSVRKYPFRTFSFDKDMSIEGALASVVEHFTGVKRTFSQIQRMLPLDKADFENEPEEVERLLCSTFPIVLASVDSLQYIERNFKTVISFVGVETNSAVSSNTNRTVYFSNSFNDLVQPDASLTETHQRAEILRILGREGGKENLRYNPGLKYTCQQIKIPASDKQVNVAEGTYLVSLYQFMRLIGYRHEDITIVVTSPYMKLLVEELLEDKKIEKGSVPIDLPSSFAFGWPLIQLASQPQVLSKYVLFSCHGDMSFKHTEIAISSASLGFYAFGSHSSPFYIKIAPLEIFTGANLQATIDDREKGSSAYVIEGSEHMAEYVEQITAARQKAMAN